jgi:hypothetical protein
MRHKIDGSEGKENWVLRYSTFCDGKLLGRLRQKDDAGENLELVHVCSCPLEPISLRRCQCGEYTLTLVTSHLMFQKINEASEDESKATQ